MEPLREDSSRHPERASWRSSSPSARQDQWLPGTPPCTFSLVDSQAERLPREHHSLCPRPTEYAAWTLQVARRSIKTMMVTSEPSGDTGGSPEDLSGRVRAPCPCGDPGALDWPGFPGTPVSTSSSPSPWTARQPLPRALVPELSKGKEKIRASLYARNCTQETMKTRRGRGRFCSFPTAPVLGAASRNEQQPWPGLKGEHAQRLASAAQPQLPA